VLGAEAYRGFSVTIGSYLLNLDAKRRCVSLYSELFLINL
jgi:hypothetical protein